MQTDVGKLELQLLLQDYLPLIQVFARFDKDVHTPLHLKTIPSPVFLTHTYAHVHTLKQRLNNLNSLQFASSFTYISSTNMVKAWIYTQLNLAVVKPQPPPEGN